jgi:hypothetical protein
VQLEKDIVDNDKKSTLEAQKLVEKEKEKVKSKEDRIREQEEDLFQRDMHKRILCNALLEMGARVYQAKLKKEANPDSPIN